MTNMPSEAWYVLIIGLVVVLLAAIWMGRGIKIKKGSISVDPVQEATRSGTDVLKGARIEESAVGNVTGARLRGVGPEGTTDTSVEVLSHATIKGSRVGDITGVEQEPRPDRR